MPDNAKSPTGLGANIRLLVSVLRIKQWIKNLFVISPLLFSRHLFEPSYLYLSLSGALLFSLIASSVYVLNDVLDLKSDREHPVKRNRPIAAGLISVPLALILFVILAGLSLYAGFRISTMFGLVLASYIVLNVAYSVYLKRAVIIDVMCIAASFVLRILAGTVILKAPISEWLLICTSLLALFLGFSKRRHEISLLEENASAHRKVLEEYGTYFLDQMISLVTSATLICYILYTVADDTVAKFGSKNLLVTTPFVLYGLFRYYYLVHQRKAGGDPTSEFLTDVPLLVTVFLWGLSVALIIYYHG
jgi:4-hydroxybenzoate polyprenyltransferase